MDDFERKLSVALKTATRELPDHGAVTVTPVVRRGPSRLLLAAAVVVLLVAAVGGSWWAVSGTTATTPPGDAACAPADLTFAPATTPAGTDVVSAFTVTASRACSLTQAPTVTLAGQSVPAHWGTPAGWRPIALPAGVTALFTLTGSSTSRGPCSEATRPVEVRWGNDVALGYDLTELLCGPVSLGVEPTSIPTTDCTASDLTLAPLDVGGGGSTLGIEVVAKSACTLSAPPTVTLGGRTIPYAASATDHHDSTPWMPTSLAPRDHLSFSVTWAYVGLSCPLTGNNVSATASVGGTVLTDFTWFVGCAGNTSQLVLTPRAAAGSGAGPACTAADVAVASSTTNTAATLAFATREGRTCVLVDPPTVLLDSTVAQYWPSVDPAARAEWQPRTLSPGHPAAFDVTFAETGGMCPPDTADHAVHVLIGGLPVDSVPWTAAAVCGGAVVTVPH